MKRVVGHPRSLGLGRGDNFWLGASLHMQSGGDGSCPTSMQPGSRIRYMRTSEGSTGSLVLKTTLDPSRELKMAAFLSSSPPSLES